MKIFWKAFRLKVTLFALLAGEVLSEPDFAGEVQNLTVPVGRDAVFVCTVSSLGGYKVGWVKADNKAIQAIHTHVVTHNPRVSVTHSGPHIWNLHISNVRQEDAGTYMCQINTDPMKSQVAHLDITVSPDILDDETPSEVIVSEGEPVKLTCKAQGQPQPKITWRREDGRDLIDVRFRDEKGSRQYSKADSVEGEVIKWQAVSRHQMGAYFCIANNGVPPSVSKRIMVTVTFVPVVRVKSQLIGVPAKSTVSLECEVESSPKPITFWTKDGEITVANQRVIVNESRVSSYHYLLSLKILDFSPSDAGKYECHAKNVVGEANGTISLYEVIVPRTHPPTTTTIYRPRTTTTKPPAPQTVYIPASTASLQMQVNIPEHSNSFHEMNVWSQLLPKHNNGIKLRTSLWFLVLTVVVTVY